MNHEARAWPITGPRLQPIRMMSTTADHSKAQQTTASHSKSEQDGKPVSAAAPVICRIRKLFTGPTCGKILQRYRDLEKPCNYSQSYVRENADRGWNYVQNCCDLL